MAVLVGIIFQNVGVIPPPPAFPTSSPSPSPSSSSSMSGEQLIALLTMDQQAIEEQILGFTSYSQRLQSLYGALTFVAINAVMIIAQPLVLTFLIDKDIFVREHRSRTYS